MTRIARRNAPSFELALEPRAVYQRAVVQPALLQQQQTAAAAAAVTRRLQQQIDNNNSTSFSASSSGNLTSSPNSTTTQISAAGFSPSSPQWSILDGPTKITENLYLGSQSDASDLTILEACGIKRILNVAADCAVDDIISKQFKVSHIMLRDHSDENIAARFDECISFIREAIEAREPVLVHCRMGVSRSTTIVLAYLMKYGIDELNSQVLHYTTAFDYVKALRPQVSPNLGFVLSLHSIDRARGFKTPEEDLFEREDSMPGEMMMQRGSQQHLF